MTTMVFAACANAQESIPTTDSQDSRVNNLRQRNTAVRNRRIAQTPAKNQSSAAKRGVAARRAPTTSESGSGSPPNVNLDNYVTQAEFNTRMKQLQDQIDELKKIIDEDICGI